MMRGIDPDGDNWTPDGRARDGQPVAGQELPDDDAVPRRASPTTSWSSRSAVAAATLSTASAKAAALCGAGSRNPLILRTYWRAAARTSSSPT